MRWLSSSATRHKGETPMKPMLMVVNFILVLAALAASPAYGQTELYKQTLFVYDDSWQSKVEWDDCTFCIPRSTVRWRALRHEMTLVVNGPNNQYVQNAVNACMQEAAGAGLQRAVWPVRMAEQFRHDHRHGAVRQRHSGHAGFGGGDQPNRRRRQRPDESRWHVPHRWHSRRQLRALRPPAPARRRTRGWHR